MLACLPLVGAALLLSSRPGLGQAGADPALRATLDSLVRAHLDHPQVPGLAVAVVHRGDTLLHGGFGEADLEFHVPMPVDARFEIGSITKQFTAAAILQLVERGVLDLDADLRTVLPEFEYRVAHLPLRHLLDHTAGFRSYTEMPVFQEIVRDSLPRDTLVSLVERQPLDFLPGLGMIYNNSAYFFLGLIIERATGMTYAEYVERHLFAPADMRGSYYCDEDRIVEGRANGYDATPTGELVRAAYLDHTWPYAAGSLCSTVGDLIAWNRALHGGRILEPDTYATMVRPSTLRDGTPLRYGMGLAVHAVGGRPVLEHSGGINGFLSTAAYFPQDELIVVVLQNSTGPAPGPLAHHLAAAVLGDTGEAEPVGGVAPALDALVGSFAGPARGRTLTVEVTAAADGLVIRDGDRTFRPTWAGGDVWVEGAQRFEFRRRDGVVHEVHVDVISGHYVLRPVG